MAMPPLSDPHDSVTYNVGAIRTMAPTARSTRAAEETAERRPGNDADPHPGAHRGTRARPTSRDVARAAGVSQATVSLVLGGKWRGRVSERTAQAVRAAAGELGYRPNLAARSLRLGAPGRRCWSPRAHPRVLRPGLRRRRRAWPRSTASGSCSTPRPPAIGPARDPFGSARAAIDGVIASSMAADALAGIGDGGLPLVMLDSDPDVAGRPPTVNLAVADGMRQVARHLLGLGHRRITHIAADVDTWTFRVRTRPSGPNWPRRAYRRLRGRRPR